MCNRVLLGHGELELVAVLEAQGRRGLREIEPLARRPPREATARPVSVGHLTQKG